MPTPVGHALGGLATAWFSHRRPSKLLLVLCVVAAVAADLDILIQSHRSYTHSVGAAALVAILVWGIARWLRPPSHSTAVHVALTIAAAYSTHIFLDWLGKDTAPPEGLLALWPFSSRYYISGVDLFMEISRRYWKPDEFIVGNLKAGAWELLLLGPIVVLAWYLSSHHRGRR